MDALASLFSPVAPQQTLIKHRTLPSQNPLQQLAFESRRPCACSCRAWGTNETSARVSASSLRLESPWLPSESPLSSCSPLGSTVLHGSPSWRRVGEAWRCAASPSTKGREKETVKGGEEKRKGSANGAATPGQGAGKKAAAGGKAGGSRGFGSAAPPKKANAGLDGATLLRLSRKEWGKLQEEDSTRHYIISVKRKEGPMLDWLPVGYLALLAEEEGSEAVAMVLPHLNREVLECAKLYSSLFDSCRCNDLEYAFELEGNFLKKEMVKQYMDQDEAQNTESKEVQECPYAVLGLEKDASSSQVRTAYRSLAAAHHPDRNADRDDAETRFKRVVEAYDRIKAKAGGEKLVGGSSSGVDSLKEVDVKGAPESTLPTGMRAGVVPVDFNLTDLFLPRRFRGVHD